MHDLHVDANVVAVGGLGDVAEDLLLVLRGACLARVPEARDADSPVARDAQERHPRLGLDGSADPDVVLDRTDREPGPASATAGTASAIRATSAATGLRVTGDTLAGECVKTLKKSCKCCPASPASTSSATSARRCSTWARRSRLRSRVRSYFQRGDTRRDVGAARRTDRGRRGHRHAQRGRGAHARAEPRQAPPPALQHPAARRQVVPVHRGDDVRRVPARHVHARATPPRHRLLRPLREREEGARDARRPEPRVQVPALRRPAAGPPLRDPVPRLPHRPLLRAVRARDLARGLRRDHRRRRRVPLRGDGRRSSGSSRRGCRRRRPTSASRRPRATATASSRSGTSPSGRPRTSARSGRST